MVSLTADLPSFLYHQANHAARENLPAYYTALEMSLDYIMVGQSRQPHATRLREQLFPYYKLICATLRKLCDHYAQDDGSQWWSYRRLLMTQIDSVLSGFVLNPSNE